MAIVDDIVEERYCRFYNGWRKFNSTPYLFQYCTMKILVTVAVLLLAALLVSSTSAAAVEQEQEQDEPLRALNDIAEEPENGDDEDLLVTVSATAVEAAARCVPDGEYCMWNDCCNGEDCQGIWPLGMCKRCIEHNGRQGCAFPETYCCDQPHSPLGRECVANRCVPCLNWGDGRCCLLYSYSGGCSDDSQCCSGVCRPGPVGRRACESVVFDFADDYLANDNDDNGEGDNNINSFNDDINNDNVVSKKSKKKKKSKKGK
mmetsp:Transcript_23054/g.26474  ORF Transcript_23054/g.26474 Transcript_23054/m.26474 type:complete len:260 (+) Transcript_23054:2-781(+)